MAQTLSTLIQAAVLKMGKRYCLMSYASGLGTTTTLVDSKLSTDYATDDELNGFTLIITKDAGLANAAPEGEIAQITGYTASTGTCTFAALTAIPTGNDEYMIVKNIPKIALYNRANDALSSLGLLHFVDTSLTTTDDTYEYALPTTCKIQRPLAINYYDSDDDKYYPSPYAWEYIPAVGGSTGKIRFVETFTAGYTLEIHYLGYHSTLTRYSSVIDERIPLELAATKMACDLFAYLGITDNNRDEANYAQAQWERAQQMFKIEKKVRQAQYLHFGG